MATYVRPWRRGSDYTPPPINDLDRHQLQVWRDRVFAEAQDGNLPSKAIFTAKALIDLMGRDGRLFPSQAAIAALSGNSPRSVVRHLKIMALLNLIEKHRRLVRMPWPEGGRGAVRVQQTSNAYRLTFPACAVAERPTRARHNSGRHIGAVESYKSFSLVPLVPTIGQVEAKEALEKIRIKREAVMRMAWLNRSYGGLPVTG